MSTYRVTRKLGVGTLFESYAGVVRHSQGAEHPVWLRRLVAPWAQDAGFIDRFSMLAEHWRALSPEVVTPLVEYGTGADSTWVTQSLVDGESIRTMLSALSAKQLRPQTNEVVAIGIRVASALATIHDQSLDLHHGDLCASTIHLTPDGRVLFTDFGIATAAGLTPQTGPARCEAHAMAPEQQGGRYFASSDVYRLGLVLLELVTGRASPGSSWPGVPEKLATALSWMLAKDPTQRPQARDVENALQVAAEQSGWSVDSNDLVRFLARLMPDRVSQTAIPPTGGTELQLKPAASREPQLTPTPPGATLARISTRKVTAETLAAEKERAEKEAAARVPPTPPWRETKVAEALIARQKLTADQLQEAMAHAESVQGTVDDALISMGLCDEDLVIAAEAELTKTPAIPSKRLLETKPPPEVLGRLTAEDAEALNAVPLWLKAADQLVIAVRDPLQPELVENLRRLTKAGSILAVRAGPAALARAIGALYRGVDVEDPSSWLETASGAPLASAPRAFADAGPGLELEPGPGSEAMELELRGTLASPSKSNATLDDPQATLFEAVLGLLGEKGKQVSNLVALAGGLTRRLGASESDVGKVRFGAAAIGVVNVTAGKQPWEPVRAESVAPVAGSGWRSVHELVGRALEVSKGPPSDLAMLALMTALVLSAAAGSSKPTGPSLANGLQALKTRQFPKLVLDAVARELK